MVKVAICDYDEKYLESLLSYLYGKCESNSFSTFTNVIDYIASYDNNSYDYTIISDNFYEAVCKEGVSLDKGKQIILSTSLDDSKIDSGIAVIYKYGPMDSLLRMMTADKRYKSDGLKYAVYSPTHHELSEMYGLSMCQMLAESKKVLLIDTMHCPIVKKLIRDGPVNSLIDVIYKLENNKSDEISSLIQAYGDIDILPLSNGPLDVASISKEQWHKLINYIDSLHVEVCVFLIEDLNSGFKEIMSYVDRCILINKRGDYYKDTINSMRDYISGLGTKTIPVELTMSASNLTEGYYQLEELLTGNLGRFVRSQYIS